MLNFIFIIAILFLIAFHFYFYQVHNDHVSFFDLDKNLKNHYGDNRKITSIEKVSKLTALKYGFSPKKRFQLSIRMGALGARLYKDYYQIIKFEDGDIYLCHVALNTFTGNVEINDAKKK